MTPRIAEVSRDTKETQIKVRVNLDGTGQADLSTGIGFFDHMLDQIARHGLIDLYIHAKGDLHIDGHHTVEDVGITLGQAVAKAVGDKKGIRRYGHAYVPLDEALSRVVVDFSGRPGLEGLCPCAAIRFGNRPALRGRDSFHQGFALIFYANRGGHRLRHGKFAIGSAGRHGRGPWLGCQGGYHRQP